MKRKLEHLVNILPILLIGIILFYSAYLFDKNKEQTYNRVKNLKEAQVQIIAEQIDASRRLTNQPMNDDTKKILKELVENVNEQKGVYCYLFDKQCNLISSFSKQQKHVTGEALIDSLRSDNITVTFTHEYHGYIEVPVNGKTFEVYWQGLPSGSREDCEYFIMLTVAKEEIQVNEAINSCKVMIGLLTIALGASLYANLYMEPYYNKRKRMR